MEGNKSKAMNISGGQAPSLPPKYFCPCLSVINVIVSSSNKTPKKCFNCKRFQNNNAQIWCCRNPHLSVNLINDSKTQWAVLILIAAFLIFPISYSLRWVVPDAKLRRLCEKRQRPEEWAILYFSTSASCEDMNHPDETANLKGWTPGVASGSFPATPDVNGDSSPLTIVVHSYCSSLPIVVAPQQSACWQISCAAGVGTYNILAQLGFVRGVNSFSVRGQPNNHSKIACERTITITTVYLSCLIWHSQTYVG